MYSKTENVDREIKEGDFVLLDVKGKSKDNEISELTRAGYPVFIRGEDKDSDWPFPGFGKKLLGLKAGDTSTLTYNFPEDHNSEELKGLSAEFEIIIKTVRGVTLPELNDEFAKSVGVENIEELIVGCRTKPA